MSINQSINTGQYYCLKKMKMTDRMTGWMGGFECTDVNEEVPANNLLNFLALKR
jgi:hypothetical protein